MNFKDILTTSVNSRRPSAWWCGSAETAGLEKARLELNGPIRRAGKCRIGKWHGPNRRGGKCRTGIKRTNSQGWKLQDRKTIDEFAGQQNDGLNCLDGNAGPIKCSEESHTRKNAVSSNEFCNRKTTKAFVSS